jgi:tetratricopeptide (TPR) repeat protein
VADTDIKLETLAPRADVTAVVAIFYGGRGWTFTQAGNYTITALYRNPLDRSANPVRSNPLSISVALGNGAGEFLIKDDAGEEAGKFLLWQQGDHLRKGIRRLTDLIERYPDSPLADYAQLALGLNLSRAFKDYSIGQVRKPDYELARRYLQKVQPTRLPINLQVENTLAQARSAGKLGHTDEARRLVQQAKQLAGDRPYLLSRFEEILSRTPELR